MKDQNPDSNNTKFEKVFNNEVLSYSKISKSIRITVIPDYIEENSDPKNDLFAFSYNINVENLSDKTVQLLERHWIIMSAGVQIAEVVGPGVVGYQPVLEPGHSFEYTSGAVIHDPFGSMHGSYTFKHIISDLDSNYNSYSLKVDNKELESFFSVDIPKFDLIFPSMLH